jgi:hypothetical protein
LLARSVVQGYGGKGAVRLGELRRLRAREEVRRHALPAIFVDDVLVATPNDFGFYGPARRRRAAATHR